jgi:hypothetical protein
LFGNIRIIGLFDQTVLGMTPIGSGKQANFRRNVSRRLTFTCGILRFRDKPSEGHSQRKPSTTFCR